MDESSTEYTYTTQRPEDRRPQIPKPQSNAQSRTRRRTDCDVRNRQEDITKTATTITMLADGSKHTNKDGTEETKAIAATTTTPAKDFSATSNWNIARITYATSIDQRVRAAHEM